MPELPEVETVRAGLDSLITGSRIVAAHVRRDSCVRLLPGGAAQFAAMTADARIGAVARRGKFLWLPLVHGDEAEPAEALSAHLGMSGQFRVHEGAPPEPHPHCRARLSLDRDGTDLTLDFLDQRTFGYLHVEPLVETADALAGGAGSELAALPSSVAHIGRDALDPRLDAAAASRAWRRGARGIKQVLLDQTLVSGIGNIYADEALWIARVHPERPAHAVSASQARVLLDASCAVMARALVQGGTSFDALYVNVNGESGYFSRSLEAYGRGGEPCRRCGRPLRRESIGGRATHWCATCQRRYAPRTSASRLTRAPVRG
ncbi:bifunctional DNA-formamidopyrimidine glycosylase/DNA-(apurinic or apyrimidinic site) lyase [Demequina sp. NBRC 110053]|uniref:bifunctional DNA-formamidopyrimidine glycosylase/DNA-(apurinic or apyrimidinic site) lyase n=1 Tax=Demequina sp. NBRC 110053 TaxID=1570342 RepID=UPI000A01ECAF|nr:bifunctional DNA-formamidopyrimidine glycosylase/DNA-(apurinic or apyrimidinic site) lyase [Demequina sp. NBRC 110053]